MNKNPLVAIAALMVGGALLLSRDEKENEKEVLVPNSIYDDPNLEEAMKASNPSYSEEEEEELLDDSDEEDEEEEDEDFEEEDEDDEEEELEEDEDE